MTFESESLLAIREYKEYNSIIYKSNGNIFCAEVIAENEIKEIYRGLTEFSFITNRYGVVEIDISWSINESAMRQLGLHMGYNSRFQRFTFEDGKLIINAKPMTIMVGIIQNPPEEELD